MSQHFPAAGSGRGFKWAVAIALLIDIPFLLSISLFARESEPTFILVMVLLLAISGLIVYASYSAGRMEYVIGEDELRVSFPLSHLRIGYSKIGGARKVETNLRFRLFGGSLPGAHWGTFTTSNLGNAQVYATRYRGEFVVLELSDGKRILLSPGEPDAFLEALKGKTTLVASAITATAEPSSDRKLIYVQVGVVALAWLAFVYYVASIYPGLPEIIPVHFGLDGVPNRYGSKLELFVLVGISALFPTLNTVFVVKSGKYNKGLTVFLSAIFLLAVGLFAFVVNQILRAI